ncbi:hypothetical protein SAMN06309944_2053 [Micrococcales bacterium KH10]|nr:hypothetical protein SAMN06309944_2053 [Micrococcales bacterium KH10]
MRVGTKTRIGALGTVATLCITGLAAVPSAHAAPSWTLLNSGTTHQIAAVDYKGSTIAYATSGGQLAVGSVNGTFAITNSPTVANFTELELNPSGTRTFAIGTGDDDGELYVYDGTTWTRPDLSTATVASRGSGSNCTAQSPDLAAGPVTNVEFSAVAWASETQSATWWVIKRPLWRQSTLVMR